MAHDDEEHRSRRASTVEIRGLLNRRVLAAYRQRLAAARWLGMTESEVTALAYLAQRPRTPSELGESLLLSSGGVTALVRRMEQAGHVTREPHPTDKRSVMVHAARESVERAAACFAALAQDTDAATDRLSVGEKEAVRAYLERIAEVSERSADTLVAQIDDTDPLEDDDPIPIWA